MAGLPSAVVPPQGKTEVLEQRTKVAASVAATCRARPEKEFVAKLGIVVEEADETLFWPEMLVELGELSPSQVTGLKSEANELVSTFAGKGTAEQSTIDNRQSTIDHRPSGYRHV